jgi:NAD-dependent deacetylase sirtuin 5
MAVLSLPPRKVCTPSNSYRTKRSRILLSALRASPNNAHRVLSAFSLSTFRDQVAPGSTFTLITQNVDGLSPKSDKEIAEKHPEEVANSTKSQLIEMHGRLFDVECTDKMCGHSEHNLTSPICESLGGTEAMTERGTIDPIIDTSRLPRCPACGSLARPGVVWFGETPYHMNTIDDLVMEADLCLVVGTSSTVSL